MRELESETIASAVAQACMRAACMLPDDVSDALKQALASEESAYGRYALGKIVENASVASEESMPLCQDTGLVVVFAEVGQDLHIVGATLEESVNAGVSRGYENGYLRKSIVSDPLFKRQNTEDNTPAIVHIRQVAGCGLVLHVLPKGGGSENMSMLGMLKPTSGVDEVADFVVEAVEKAGGNPCPPVIVGVGVGGNAEQSLILSKKALLRPVGQRSEDDAYAGLEEAILDRVNQLGIGPQGFGGFVTALDVHIEHLPTHIAMLPVGVSINCHAARHVRIEL